jgi:hypothetical protein
MYIRERTTLKIAFMMGVPSLTHISDLKVDLLEV